MHIADFRVGHLGANAIVGGGIPIATGAAMTCRIDDNMKGRVVCSFAGDGAYSNGVVLESLNWASQDQFDGPLAETKFGLPIIYCLINNHYGMTGRADGEVTGVDHLARRAAGFDNDNMHAEVVNGMDILAVRDAIGRAKALAKKGEGPILLEFDTYRYYGHSLSDPRNEYRTREEEARWKEVDPVVTFRRRILEAKIMNEKELSALEAKVAARNARAARRAADAPDPNPADVIKYMYTDGSSNVVPAAYADPKLYEPLPRAKPRCERAWDDLPRRNQGRALRGNGPATSASCSSVRTSPNTAAPSNSRKVCSRHSAATASSTPRSPKPASAARRSAWR